jgi:hypothetical protein
MSGEQQELVDAYFAAENAILAYFGYTGLRPVALEDCRQNDWRLDAEDDIWIKRDRWEPLELASTYCDIPLFHTSEFILVFADEYINGNHWRGVILSKTKRVTDND